MSTIQRLMDQVEAYLAALPSDQRAVLEDVRRQVRAVVPGAVEVFGYGMPGFKHRGRPLLYMGAWKDHCSIYAMGYAAIERHHAELASYELGKGTIRFRPELPLPAELLRTIVAERMADIDAVLDAARQRNRRGRTGRS